MLTSFVTRSGNLASGQVGWPHLASGAVRSGALGDASVLSGNIGSGQVASGHLTSGLIAALGSVTLLSGQVTSGFLGDNSVVSGSIASGQLSSYNMASGAVIDFSMGVTPWFPGLFPTITAGERIFAGHAVCLSTSGLLNIAMASVSGRMPAIGCANSAVLSGNSCSILTAGTFQFGAGVVDYSGYTGQLLYVGRSGDIVTISGSWNSGGLQSGDIVQPVGFVTNSGGMCVSVAAMLPFVTSLVASGDVASGQIGWPLIGDAGVFSGNIGSGQVTAGHIQSGSLTSVLVASGGFLSGSLASGTLINALIASGGFLSGAIASGTLTNFLIQSGGLRSGVLGSGTIFVYPHASGDIVMHALEHSPLVSGGLGHTPLVITAEAISGVRAVNMNSSGQVRIAMAAVSGRMPAVGIVYDNIASGISCNVHLGGFIQYPDAGSGKTIDFSGKLGRRVFVGNSGGLWTTSGDNFAGTLSGSWGSGANYQPVGWVVNSGGVIFNVTPISFSGHSVLSGIPLLLGQGAF